MSSGSLSAGIILSTFGKLLSSFDQLNHLFIAKSLVIVSKNIHSVSLYQ